LAAPAQVGSNVDIPAFAAEGFEIGDGRFRSRNDYQASVRRNDLAGVHKVQQHAWLEAERIKIVEIGNSGKPQNRNFDPG
jgi:hypothetical protein